MALSTKFGVAASFFQTSGTLFHSKIASGISIFDFFPKVIGMSLYMASGFCWFMEALTEETEQADRWTHIKSRFNQVKFSSLEAPGMVWGFAAGALSLVAGGLSLLALYAAAGPLFWTASALTALAGVFWLKSSKGNSVANRMNQAASSFQIISAALFVAAVFFPPLAPLGFLFGIASAGLWLSSYALDKVFPLAAQEELVVPKPQPEVLINWMGTKQPFETANNSPSNPGSDVKAPVKKPLLHSPLLTVIKDEYTPGPPIGVIPYSN